MLKRLFDIVFSLLGLILLLPVFILLALLIIADSRGGVFYNQIRVGKNNKDFLLYKFRTMRPGADQKGLLTVGGRDPRVTAVGYFLRKFKLDELPQLFNVLNGSMSLVGPRPEVRKYVNLYNEEQKQVLKVRPGITDYASLEYFKENELLALSADPEKTYIEEVMPAKLKLNKRYLEQSGILTDIKIIFRTIGKVFH
jgi:lipopolysaccharide/colanic/teichoic acid biosynthesis glycosyltransferase